MARVVIPGIPHHVTQRGVRKNNVFFCPNDYKLYINLLSKYCRQHNTEIWAYCLMHNHIHLIMVPSCEDGLRATLGETHRHYTLHVNEREHCRGHLWQERFHSFPMDEHYLLAATRYVELNPVQANIVAHAEDYTWSSAKAHLSAQDDQLVKVKPMLSRVHQWQEYLDNTPDTLMIKSLREHSQTGRPLGNNSFVDQLEHQVGKILRPLKQGRKKQSNDSASL